MISSEAMVYFEYYHKEPQIAGELCQILEASGQVVPDDLRRIAREVEEGQDFFERETNEKGGDGAENDWMLDGWWWLLTLYIPFEVLKEHG